MMRIALIQVDGKLPNLALMKISSYHKSLGAQVEFATSGRKYDKVYIAVLFSWNREKAVQLARMYQNVEIGGTGYDIEKTLSPEIESCRPDYDLYTAETIIKGLGKGIRKRQSTIKKAQIIANMGIGFTSRGCIRNCSFCLVRKKEGCLRQESTIAEILNPRSNYLTLYDNNLTADPECLDKLGEIRDRQLIVDISQGIDVRIVTDEIALGLSEIRHLRSLHYAWDLMEAEQQVLSGIAILSKRIKTWRHLCFILAGYNTSHEEDMYRVRKLTEIGVSPYVMKYNNRTDDVYLNHFARWVNGRFYKVCRFEDYDPWKRQRDTMNLFGEAS